MTTKSCRGICRRAATTVWLVLFLALGPHAARAQVDLVFDDTVLPEVRIQVDPADLAAILAQGNEESDTEYLASFQWVSPLVTASVDSVGFRLRGNTSRHSQKKSFKVSFNTFRQGGKWEGLEKLNLNGEHNDPSIMRAKLAWDLFADLGVPASRANHVRLFVNDEYRGLYLNVEHVDEQFLQRYFGSDGGNLYKALWPADLSVRGSDGAAYRPDGPDRRPYDLTQGASDEEGYDDLAAFITLINTTSTAQFKGAIERAMDVDGLLRAQAVTALTGSWDTYWFLKNNYYLYNNPKTGRWHYVPFDMDNSFGIWWDGIAPGIDWSSRDVYAWGHPNEDRPLMRRVLGVPEFRQRYTYYLRQLLDGSFVPATLHAEIGRLKALTEAAAEEDVYRTLDWDYSVEDYHDSFTLALGERNPDRQAHVTAGLLPFISNRFQSSHGQLDLGAIAPLISDIVVAPETPRPTDPLRVSARVVGTPVEVQVQYWPDRPEMTVVTMSAGSADTYHAVVPPLGAAGTVDLRIRAVDGSGAERTSSLLRIGVDAHRPSIYINELMADNQSALVDDAGDFDDWLELYNGMDVPFHLSGYTLSDDPARPDRWALPDVFVPENGFLVLWMDGQPEQGMLHAPFRLSSGGESVTLYAPDGSEADFVGFPALGPDEAWSRVGDGLPDFAVSVGTPGGSNAVGSGIEPSASVAVSAYPNPFFDVLRVSGGQDFEVFDVLGRRVHRGDGRRAEWDASGVAPGVYVVRFDDGVGRSLTVVKAR